MAEFVFDRIEIIVGKCWLPAFSPFHTIFSKVFFLRGIKRCHCVGQGLLLQNLRLVKN